MYLNNTVTLFDLLEWYNEENYKIIDDMEENGGEEGRRLLDVPIDDIFEYYEYDEIEEDYYHRDVRVTYVKFRYTGYDFGKYNDVLKPICEDINGGSFVLDEDGYLFR